MTTALVPFERYDLKPDELDGWLRVVAGAKGRPLEAMQKISIGASYGIAPGAALATVHMIEERPSLSATTWLGLANARGIRHRWVRSDETAATLRLRVPSLDGEGWEHVDTTYTIEQARASGLTSSRKGEKANWANHTAAMLRARCTTLAIRMHVPELTLGGTAYEPGELRAALSTTPTDQPASLAAALDQADAAVVDVEAVVDPAVVARAISVLEEHGVDPETTIARLGEPETWTADTLDAARGMVREIRAARRERDAQPAPVADGGEE